MRQHISYSEWILFKNDCKYRWKLDYVDGLRSKNYGINLDFGTAVHSTIERLKTRKDDERISDGAKYFEEYFTKLYNENVANYSEKDKSVSLKEFLDAGKNILSKLDECKELSEAKVLYNEYELLQPISRTDDININFKGFIDIVIKSKDGRGKDILYVCDFKTCSWGWTQDKKQDRDMHAQILLYKYFLCKKFDLDPKNVRTAFILLKKKPRPNDNTVEFFPISAGPVSVQRALDELNISITDMELGLRNDNIIKDKEKCKGKYGDICPYFGTKHCTLKE
jgi:hypothetical protein